MLTRSLLTILLLFLFVPGFSIGNEALIDSANGALAKGNLSEAVALYHRAIKRGENEATLFFNLGNALYQMDSLSLSVVYYRAAVERAPDYFRAYLNLATAYYMLDDMGSCIAIIQRGLHREPDNPKGLRLLGAAYQKITAWPQAVSTFERLYEIDPLSEEPYLCLSEIYKQLSDNESALRWLERYPENGKNRVYLLISLSELHKKEGRIEKALFCIREAFDLEPSNRWALYEMVVLQAEAGQTWVALDEARNGLSLFPDFPELAVLAGNIAFNQKRFDQAEHFYGWAADKGSAAGVVGLENLRSLRLSTDISASQNADNN